MNDQISWGQTVGAAIVSVVVFFLLLYVAAPIIESLLNLHGRLFVPERYGGGSEVDNPGLLTLAFRAIMASGLSAVGAFMAGFKLFSSAHAKTVSVVFGLVIVAWAGLFVLAGLSSGAVLMPLLMVGLGAAPPLFVAYWAWQGEF
jgi:hypothetical protein